jgi:hypothetical protein
MRASSGLTTILVMQWFRHGKHHVERHPCVWQTVGLLKTSPFIGRKRTDLKYPGIRSWRVEHFTRWLIFYGLREDALVLYRVRSGTMNLAALKLVS